MDVCINGGMTCKNRENIFAANILDAKRGTTPIIGAFSQKKQRSTCTFLFPL